MDREQWRFPERKGGGGGHDGRTGQRCGTDGRQTDAADSAGEHAAVCSESSDNTLHVKLTQRYKPVLPQFKSYSHSL